MGGSTNKMQLYVFLGLFYVTQLQSEFFNLISVARWLDWQSIIFAFFALEVQHNVSNLWITITFVYYFMLGNAYTPAKAALPNEIRTLKQAGRHPNIANLIGTRV